jgi:hypothetical protein
MASVWVVEQGEYSDYSVLGVYSTQEGAELAAGSVNGKDARASSSLATVAEWPLDPNLEELRQGLSLWFVNMGKDGGVSSVGKQGTLDPSNEPWWFNAGFGEWRWIDCVWATDARHAVKVVNERRVQMIANGTWREAGWKDGDTTS